VIAPALAARLRKLGLENCIDRERFDRALSRVLDRVLVEIER
jgi:hypothetical protein